VTTGQKRQLTGAVGEFRVAAELCRRGLLATPFSGNVPHYDIVASGQQGGHVVVQVKAINGGSWQFEDIRLFVEVQLEETPRGPRQVVGRLAPEPYPGLVYVLVLLSQDANDRFFVLTWTELRQVIVDHHRRYLAKHDGVRPKAPESFHSSLSVDDIAAFEGKWESVERSLR
jgi:hypothetical protein